MSKKKTKMDKKWPLDPVQASLGQLLTVKFSPPEPNFADLPHYWEGYRRFESQTLH